MFLNFMENALRVQIDSEYLLRVSTQNLTFY